MTQTLTLEAPADRDVIARFVVHGEPISKARARFTKRGSKVVTYTPEKTKTGEMLMAAAYRAAGGKKDPSKETTFGVMATFHHGTHHRRDVDNMLKLVLDGLNGVAWMDDTQVVEVAARKRYAGSRDLARTEVIVYRVGVVDRKTTPCARCGAEMPTFDSWNRRYCGTVCREEAKAEKRAAARAAAGGRRIICEGCGGEFISLAKTPRRFCSDQCRRYARSGRVTISCGTCETRFEQYASWAKQGRIYCSEECVKVHNAQVARERRTKTFYGTCGICGAGTTRKEYTRCGACKCAGKVLKPSDRLTFEIEEVTA